jgi:hypothetical protein
LERELAQREVPRVGDKQSSNTPPPSKKRSKSTMLKWRAISGPSLPA